MDPLNQLDQRFLNELSDRFGLPLHIIFAGRFRQNCDSFKAVLKLYYPHHQIGFAVKSNPCRGAVRLAARAGLGADVVSEFELRTAIEEGIAPERIICNGNGKSRAYIEMALACGATIAVDGSWELKLIGEIAGKAAQKAKILLRFSGMSLGALTAADQMTASEWTKFGFPIDGCVAVIEECLAQSNVELLGFSAHIGTQICDPSGYDRMLANLLRIAATAAEKGVETRMLDLGGGFPVSYINRIEWDEFKRRLRLQLLGELQESQYITWDNIPLGCADDLAKYRWGSDPGLQQEWNWRGKAYWSEFPGAAMLERTLSYRVGDVNHPLDRLHELGDPLLVIEPGRALIGTAGLTLARVAGVKLVRGNAVVVLELGIVNHGTNLVTPDIYPFTVLPGREDDQPAEAFVAGHLCFTGDMISKIKVKLNRMPKRGDIMAIHHTGAYCADHFASNSCGFPRPAKVAVGENGQIEVWRARESFEDLFPQI